MSSIYTISGSALVAQRRRLGLIAANMANADSTAARGEQPYRAQFAVFQAEPLDNGGLDPTGDAGVRVSAIAQSSAPFKNVYAPGNPLANAQGYVQESNVSMVQQMTDMIDATNGYRANLALLQQTQQINQALIQAI